MALPISIERLLDGRTVEGHRIEFKAAVISLSELRRKMAVQSALSKGYL